MPRTLPKILSPAEVDALVRALRTHRDRAMVFAMVLGGLRRCEVLGLRLCDISVAERTLFIAEGKGGHQRITPISNTFFASLGDYLREERPTNCPTDRVFVALKGPSRGRGLSVDGIDVIMREARRRAGLERATCHQLRHTCLTRLREAGMALEAVQAQAGHISIESTRVYLHLTNDWLANEYRQAIGAHRCRARQPSCSPWKPSTHEGPPKRTPRALGSRRPSPTGNGPCSGRLPPGWLPPCAATWSSSPPSSLPGAWKLPTTRCASWPAGWWPRPT